MRTARTAGSASRAPRHWAHLSSDEEGLLPALPDLRQLFDHLHNLSGIALENVTDAGQPGLWVADIDSPTHGFDQRHPMLSILDPEKIVCLAARSPFYVVLVWNLAPGDHYSDRIGPRCASQKRALDPVLHFARRFVVGVEHDDDRMI